MHIAAKQMAIRMIVETQGQHKRAEDRWKAQNDIVLPQAVADDDAED